MPYVDKGEPQPTNVPNVLPYIAGVVAAGVAVWLWGAMFSSMNNIWLPPLLGGVLVGGAIRATSKRPVPYGTLAAILLAVLSGGGGYIYRHIYIMVWNVNGQPFKPDLNNALSYLFNDMMAFMLIAFSGYLAFVMTSMIPYPTQQSNSPPQQ